MAEKNRAPGSREGQRSKSVFRQADCPVISALSCSLELSSFPKSLLVAVSGGMDSSVLLHGCWTLSQTVDPRIQIEVAHVDHAVRDSSRQEAQFVRAQAVQYGASFHSKRLEIPQSGANREAWWRRERYRFFDALRTERNIDWVLTAHHADDQLETFLMRLVSNKELRPIRSVDQERRCLRPFLDLRRVELREYALQKGIEWVEDESNRDISRLRNRIRHRFIPLLGSEFGNSAIESVRDQSKKVVEDNLFLERLASEATEPLKPIDLKSPGWLRDLIDCLSSLDHELAWRVVECLLKEQLRFNLGRKHAARVIEFLRERRLSVQLPAGWELRRKNGGLLLDQKSTKD